MIRGLRGRLKSTVRQIPKRGVKVSYKCPPTHYGYKISHGNVKMGNVYSFSVIWGITCPRNAPCRIKCYIPEMERHTDKSATKTYWRNYRLLKGDGYDDLIADVSDICIRESVPMFRWNVSGDVWNAEYWNAIFTIATNVKTTQFLVFTKQYVVLDKFLFETGWVVPSNLKIYLSEWGDYKPSNRLKSQFRVAYYQNVDDGIIVNDDKAVVCPGLKKRADGSRVTCEQCKICFRGRVNVIFNDH